MSVTTQANRLTVLHARLPEWLQARRIFQESADAFVLSKGSN